MQENRQELLIALLGIGIAFIVVSNVVLPLRVCMSWIVELTAIMAVSFWYFHIASPFSDASVSWNIIVIVKNSNVSTQTQ